jgi:hypothetical protein
VENIPGHVYVFTALSFNKNHGGKPSNENGGWKNLGGKPSNENGGWKFQKHIQLMT